MFKPLYLWMMDKSRHPKAAIWLTGISAAESFIFPIPPDVMLIPMALAQRNRAFRYAILCTLGAVIGAIIGYAIGFFFFDLLGEQIIVFYGTEDAFANIQTLFDKHEALVILIAAITPIPFKIATITAGFLQANFFTFLLAALVGRSIRYGLISLLIVLFGRQITWFLEHHFGLALSIGCVLFIAGWLFLL